MTAIYLTYSILFYSTEILETASSVIQDDIVFTRISLFYVRHIQLSNENLIIPLLCNLILRLSYLFNGMFIAVKLLQLLFQLQIEIDT